MVQTMSSPTSDLRPTPRRRTADDQTTFLSRWLKVWVILLTVVTLVVVAYLIIITNSLASINGNLATADRAVQGAGGNVVTLPNQVDRINGALSGIDPALKPIPGQVNEINAALTSINDKLTNVDSSLKDTNGVLKTILGQTSAIDERLKDADEPADNLGVQDIHQRVAAINGRPSPRQGTASSGGGPERFATAGNLNNAEQDARNILGGLQSVNASLTGICTGLRSAAGGTLGLLNLAPPRCA